MADKKQPKKIVAGKKIPIEKSFKIPEILIGGEGISIFDIDIGKGASDIILLDEDGKAVEYEKESKHEFELINIPYIEEGEYKIKYKISNLFRVELPNYWRMLYTLTEGDTKIEVIAFVLDIMDHKVYNKKFGYKK